MAPLPPRASSSPSASSPQCGSESRRKWPLDMQMVQVRGLPPLPSALHGLLRGHAQLVAARIAELQHGAEEALCRCTQSVQAVVESAVSTAVGAWLHRPANVLHQQRRRHSRKNRSFFRAHNFAAIIPGDSVAEVVVTSSIFNFLNIYNTLLITRLVLTWFPNPPEVIANPLSTICDPYLNVFRGIIPPLGGTLDLSPILAFLVLNVFTNTASALPAELPKDNTSEAGFTDMAVTQSTWRQREQSKKAGFLRRQLIAADQNRQR